MNVSNNYHYILFFTRFFAAFSAKFLSNFHCLSVALPGIGNFRGNRLWQNNTASSVYIGGGNIISTWCSLQHSMHTTPPYICHFCCCTNSIWKGREPWWNCWLSNSSGSITVCSNPAPFLHHWCVTPAAGNWWYCAFPICYGQAWINLLIGILFFSFHIYTYPLTTGSGSGFNWCEPFVSGWNSWKRNEWGLPVDYFARPSSSASRYASYSNECYH